jgi:hypothetical protein
VDGLVLRKGRRTRAILANLTHASQSIAVKIGADRARVKRLNEHTAERAIESPEAFRAEKGEAHSADRGALRMELLPYEVVRLDW